MSTTASHTHTAEMPTSRSSESSEDSEPNTTVISMSKRWTTLETIGRCMFLFSVAFFIIGVLITVFGFSNTGIDQRQQMPMKVLGPSCLAMTVVMWGVGCIFSRLWNLEWRRQQQALELRDRVQLHALAMDILNNPVISPSMLQDPRLRRQLLLKLRQQKNMDISSVEENSRRSSKAVSIDSRRRQSTTVGTSMHPADMERRKSTKSESHITDDKPTFELPGIQISRIETLDLGDTGSIISGSGRGSKRYIIIHSDMSSDFSRLSCPSDYSLAGSRSSKSRSSRASSGVSSRLWDFSPRESEWDADISLGSRESQMNVSKQDWAGGPSDYGRDEYMLSPTMPRKMSVVTFDVGDVGESFRRHSSPAYAIRGRETCTECNCGRSEAAPPPCGVLKQHRDSSCSNTSILRYCDETRRPSAISNFRKKSEASIRSLRIEEDDGDDADENTPLTAPEATAAGVRGDPQAKNHKQRIRGDRPPLVRHNTEPMRLAGSEDECIGMLSNMVNGRRESGTLRPPLRRNNTDDSEVERRVARLFKEIEFSVSDSVDESRINSQEYEGSSVRRVEAETQTISEDELTAALAASLKDMTESQSNVPNIKFPAKGGRNDSTGSYSDNLRESFESGDVNIDRPRRSSKGKEKKFKLSALSNALANLGKRASLEKKSMKPKNIPKLFQGFSDDKESSGETCTSGSKATNIKSTPPTYEDVVNKNL